MRVVFSSFVEDDLSAIADFIAQDNPSRAVTFVQEIRDRIRHLQRYPETYRLRAEIGPGARLASFGRYVILFRIADDVLRVERIVHGNRLLSKLLQVSAEVG